MGTTYNVTFIHDDIVSVENSVLNILESVNSDMSTYLDNSLITQINNSNLDQWHSINEDFLKILSYAQKLCIQTDGAYDVTIGRLVNIWGFGPETVNKKPDKIQVDSIKNQIGCDSISLDIQNKAVRKNRDIALDFSSIAKGYAIDKVYEYLSSVENIRSVFVELGGEVRSSKFKGLSFWKVGIIDPSDNSKIIQTFISKNYDSFAIATSGDYRNIRIYDTEEFSHSIDTETGISKKLDKSSVSVISNDAMSADALATALNVMPLEKALEHANDNNIKAMFIVDENNKPKLLFSQALQKVKI